MYTPKRLCVQRRKGGHQINGLRQWALPKVWVIESIGSTDPLLRKKNPQHNKGSEGDVGATRTEAEKKTNIFVQTFSGSYCKKDNKRSMPTSDSTGWSERIWIRGKRSRRFGPLCMQHKTHTDIHFQIPPHPPTNTHMNKFGRPKITESSAAILVATFMLR